MAEANIIKPHMEVLGSDGVHVGMVDALEGDQIKLTKSDSGDDRHHYVSASLVQDIRGNAVTLTRPASEAIDAAGGSQALPDDPQIGIATDNG